MSSIRRTTRRLRGCVLGITLVSTGATVVGGAAHAATTTLHWTAPGDDGNLGRATVYDLRFSSTSISPANFKFAIPVSGMPAPQPAGVHERITVAGLPDGPLYFSLRSCDESGNWSSISNLAVPADWIAGVDDAPATFASAWPNPAHLSTRIDYSLRTAGPVQVDIYDAAGRHIRSLAHGWHDAGRGWLEWDLRSDAGRRVGGGIYLLRARLADRNWVRRLVVIG